MGRGGILLLLVSRCLGGGTKGGTKLGAGGIDSSLGLGGLRLMVSSNLVVACGHLSMGWVVGAGGGGGMVVYAPSIIGCMMGSGRHGWGVLNNSLDPLRCECLTSAGDKQLGVATLEPLESDKLLGASMEEPTHGSTTATTGIVLADVLGQGTNRVREVEESAVGADAPAYNVILAHTPNTLTTLLLLVVARGALLLVWLMLVVDSLVPRQASRLLLGELKLLVKILVRERAQHTPSPWADVLHTVVVLGRLLHVGWIHGIGE